MEEILHQLIGSLSVYVQFFIHPRWCRMSSINSSVREWWKGESEESPPKRLGGILGCIIYHSQVRWRWLNPYSFFWSFLQITKNPVLQVLSLPFFFSKVAHAWGLLVGSVPQKNKQQSKTALEGASLDYYKPYILDVIYVAS